MSVWSRGLPRVIGALLAVASGTPTRAANDPLAETTLAAPSTYVLEFVATAARASDMNDAGDIVGTSYPDTGCGSACLPPLEKVVWRGGQRIVLPSVPGLNGTAATGINNQGWICGFAGSFGFGHAAVWKPDGNTYTPVDLGLLPGGHDSIAIGIDDSNRVVGYTTFPSGGQTPFMWTETDGMVDLTTLGFPGEIPLGISPSGKVATVGNWYDLDDPASATPLAAPPQSYFPQAASSAINDTGDQARFLGQLSGGQVLVYPFRYHHEGTWERLSALPTGHLSSYGVGGISAARDVTVTVQGVGHVAYGPNGLAQALSALVSPAYAGSVVTSVGPMSASGQIPAEMIIGQAGRRLVRLRPATSCTTNCVRVSNIEMSGQGPAACDQGNASATARLTVTNEAGASLPGMIVTAHFLDDYWLDETVIGTTDALGQVTFQHVGPPCVGAIAILVTRVSRHPSATAKDFLDRTTGVLTKYVIPLPAGATRQRPVSR